MTSVDLLLPKSIDSNTQQRLKPIAETLENASVWGNRNKLRILSKEAVAKDIGAIFEVEPEHVGLCSFTEGFLLNFLR